MSIVSLGKYLIWAALGFPCFNAPRQSRGPPRPPQGCPRGAQSDRWGAHADLKTDQEGTPNAPSPEKQAPT
eukprot:3798429-Pyramimonas_sp.AAC.1